MRMMIFVLAGALMTAASAQDLDGGLVEEILGERFPGAKIGHSSTRNYDEFTMYGAPFEGNKPTEVIAAEGRLGELIVEVGDDRSVLEVHRAYEKALKAAGFEEVFACKSNDCGVDLAWWMSKDRKLRIATNKPDQRYTSFQRLGAGSAEYFELVSTKWRHNRPEMRLVTVALTAVQTEAEETELAILDASAIAAAIAEGGTAAIYGIEFATDSAELLPASDPVIAEMAGYMQANPGAEILLVGHTDSVGALDYNMGLSQRRAESVRAALVQRHGIAPGRLGAHGVGFLAPAASNDSEGGRAANRRVEMVRR
ncbi:MAG: OmpA family protein [Pseudomonadota bacterium]